MGAKHSSAEPPQPSLAKVENEGEADVAVPPEVEAANDINRITHSLELIEGEKISWLKKSAGHQSKAFLLEGRWCVEKSRELGGKPIVQEKGMSCGGFVKCIYIPGFLP